MRNRANDSELVKCYHREFQEMIQVIHSLPGRAAILANRIRSIAPPKVRNSASTNLFEFDLNPALVMEAVLEVLDYDPAQCNIQKEFQVSEQEFRDAVGRLGWCVCRARDFMATIANASPRLALTLVNSPIPKPTLDGVPQSFPM